MDRRGSPHTEKLHYIERFTRTDHDTMKYQATVDDPGAYTATWSSDTFSMTWSPNQELFEVRVPAVQLRARAHGGNPRKCVQVRGDRSLSSVISRPGPLDPASGVGRVFSDRLQRRVPKRPALLFLRDTNQLEVFSVRVQFVFACRDLVGPEEIAEDVDVILRAKASWIVHRHGFLYKLEEIQDGARLPSLQKRGVAEVRDVVASGADRREGALSPSRLLLGVHAIPHGPFRLGGSRCPGAQHDQDEDESGSWFHHRHSIRGGFECLVIGFEFS